MNCAFTPFFRSDTKRTKVRKRTLDPEFDESFTFGVSCVCIHDRVGKVTTGIYM